MNDLKVYVSGKISDKDPIKQQANIDLFYEEVDKLWWRTIGLQPSNISNIFNPCDITPLFGIKKYWFHIIADLYVLIFKCNSIYLLDNWKESRGAKIELFIALLLNKKIL
jgi:hypothetical protein